MNINKKLGEIRTIQPRIATGSQMDAETRVYIYNGEFGIEATRDDEEARDYDQYNILVGYYNIIHSSIMAGSWSEIIHDWRSLITRDMLDNGTAKPHPIYGDDVAIV